MQNLNTVSQEVLIMLQSDHIFEKLLSQITRQLILKLCIKKCIQAENEMYKKSAFIPLIYICWAEHQ